MNEENVFLSTAEAQKLLGVRPTKFWEIVKADDAPKPYRLGNVCRWDRGELNEWLRSRPRHINNYSEV